MLSRSEKVFEGDVIFSGRRYMVIVNVDGQNLISCPFVADDEPRHRSDLIVDWFDLAEAGLPHGGMRLRAIYCQRESRRVQRVGTVGPGVWKRAAAAIAAEVRERTREQALATVWGARGLTARGGGRASRCHASPRVMYF